MEIILSPSILAADFSRLGEDIDKVRNAGAKWLHIDVMDGVFVPNISFGMPVVENLRKISSLYFDVHLMITKPERYIERFISAGADSITFHAEATDDIDKCIDIIKACGVDAGLAISPKTPYQRVLPYINRLDMIRCMTVEPGYGGQKYIKDVEQKIRSIRDMVDDDFRIQVDGGIAPGNIIEPIRAGANVIVAGSSVFNGDTEFNFKELEKCARL